MDPQEGRGSSGGVGVGDDYDDGDARATGQEEGAGGGRRVGTPGQQHPTVGPFVSWKQGRRNSAAWQPSCGHLTVLRRCVLAMVPQRVQ